jgi:hypothetical protein
LAECELDRISEAPMEIAANPEFLKAVGTEKVFGWA